MPYGSNRDLNARVKKAHPTGHARTVFRGAFNAALAKYHDEARAFKIGHAAADRAEGKRPRGKPRQVRRIR